MKSLHQYLTESRKIFKFKIKLAVEPTSELLTRIEKALGKFDLVSLSKPKRTPVQAHPTHFSGLQNTETWSMDAEVNYPTRPEEIKSAVQNLGVADSHIVVMTADGEMQDEIVQSIVTDNEKNSPLLLRELEKGAKETNNDYAKQGEKTVQNSLTGKINVPNAPKKAETTNDLPQGKTSPLGSTKIHKPEPKSNRR
jgi:hypothetical protein